jgi:hypothetical protein
VQLLDSARQSDDAARVKALLIDFLYIFIGFCGWAQSPLHFFGLTSFIFVKSFFLDEMFYVFFKQPKSKYNNYHFKLTQSEHNLETKISF